MTTYLSPPELARRLGINPGKIIAWIRSGEMPAINIATRLSGRPRWRISQADLVIFAARRAATVPPKSRPRRKTAGVIEFF